MRPVFNVAFMALWLALTLSACGQPDDVTTAEPADELSIGQRSEVTIVEVAPPPEGEAAAAEAMYSEAIADGIMSASDLELFVLESLECMRRAGLVVQLGNYDPSTGGIEYAVQAQDGSDETTNPAQDSCEQAYYLPAWYRFQEDNAGSVEQARLEEEARVQQALDCLAESGYEFDNIVDGLGSDLIDDELREKCRGLLIG